jgi:hypothetical protein
MKAIRPRIYNRFQGRCGYCGVHLKIGDMTIDHIIPKSIFKETIINKKDIPYFLKHLTIKDVSHIDNLMCCCKICNAWKGTKTLSQFKKEITKSVDYIKKDFNFKIALKYNLLIENPQDVKFFFEELEEQNKLYILRYASLIDEKEIKRILSEDGVEVNSEFLVYNSIKEVIFNISFKEVKDTDDNIILSFVSKEKNNKKPISIIITFKRYNQVYFLNQGNIQINLKNKYRQDVNGDFNFSSLEELLEIIKSFKFRINNLS